MTDRVIERGAAGYPSLLDQIYDPPARLYARGNVDLLSRPAVAVVGSRQATTWGLAMGERLGAGLGVAGAVVVSGCAIGIDAAAHRGALAVAGATVAVLGGGIDIGPPASNRRLAGRIARRGCLISEQPAGTRPAKYHFPKRNRIIAGLARMTVVVEATARSGALITARLALEAGREVMAVPGHPLTENAAGVNALIADGARLVRSPSDVLEELESLPEFESAPEVRSAAAAQPTTRFASRLLESMSSEPRAAERLARVNDEPVGRVLAALTELEILGLVMVHPGQRFSRSAMD